MPMIDIGDARLHYTDVGEGPETIVFSHGLLMNGGMFSAQVEALKRRYRCITYDHRGQGGSAVTDDGYDMETLTGDAAGLIEALGAGPCHFVGLSMGGFVGLRLAARRPQLLRSLVLMESSADPDPAETRKKYGMLNFVARWFGLRMVIGQVMPIMFGQSFLNDPERAGERKRWRAHILSNDRIGITRAVRGVVDRAGMMDEIGTINLPVTVIVGEEDVALVPEHSERMHKAIASSAMIRIPRAGHSSTIEQPEAVNRAISTHLGGIAEPSAAAG